MAEKTVQKNNIVEPKQVTAHARSLHIAPRKLRLVANLVKQMPAQEALTQLGFVNKKGANVVSKLIASAIANAEHNFSLDPHTLFIASITCDAAAVMKRYMPRARGSSSPLNRRMSHLHVVLESRPLKNGKKTGRFASLLKRKSSEKSAKNVPEVATDVQETLQNAPEPQKSSEQIKQNKVQQKRRLFNRRIGE